MCNRALGTEFVTIHVGPKRKPFAVHKKLICDRSDFFSKAFNSGFKESTEGVMYLPEDGADTFDSMIVYIYQDQLPVFPNTTYSQDCSGAQQFALDVLYRLFAFAEKIRMNDLANRVMDKIQDLGMEYWVAPTLPHIRSVYSLTGPGSKLRIYCALMRLYLVHSSDFDDVWTTTADDIENEEQLESFIREHPAFAVDYMKFHWKFSDRFFTEDTPDAQIRSDKDGFGRFFFHTHSESEGCHLDTSTSTEEYA